MGEDRANGNQTEKSSLKGFLLGATLLGGVTASRIDFENQQDLAAARNRAAYECSTFEGQMIAFNAPNEQCEAARQEAVDAAARAKQSQENKQNANDAMDIAANLEEELRKKEKELDPTFKEDERARKRALLREQYDEQIKKKATARQQKLGDTKRAMKSQEVRQSFRIKRKPR